MHSEPNPHITTDMSDYDIPTVRHSYSWSAGGLDTKTMDYFEVGRLRRSYRYVISKYFVTDRSIDEIADDLSIVFWYTAESKTSVLAEEPDAIITLTYLSAQKGCSVVIAADERAVTEKWLDVFVERCPKIVVHKDGKIPMKFWTDTSHGPEARLRSIETHPWPDVRRNYVSGTQEKLDRLMETARPEGAGRLVLWHGKPGTGKTTAIRALADKWMSWCDCSYIVDPEKFFGMANYMLCVVLDSSEPEYDYSDEPDIHAALAAAELRRALVGRATRRRKKESDEPRWRLLIVEDADEFLQEEAKRREGQSLSRLLNLADGLVGQGLNLLLLLTTNEPLRNIHPAVAREGRCLANVEFREFTYEEAKLWLESSPPPRASGRDAQYTLAKLYDLQRIQQQIRDDHEPFNHGQYL